MELSASNPGLSRAILRSSTGRELVFPVGSGSKGIRPEGARFVNGWSLLGRFRVTGILTSQRFEMEATLIAKSGKEETELRKVLFANMSRIDFDGDGAAREYGTGFAGLEPENRAVPQPFGFGEYRGVFRWFSYAVHGTEDESRVGRRSTGGCINLRRADLERVLAELRVGSRVEIRQIR